jgi:dolichol-phosphate mannosyltransferase
VIAEGFELDIIIPVYDEDENIIRCLNSLRFGLKTRARVLICYDKEDDSTLTALTGYDASPHQVEFVRNRGTGALNAVLTGFEKSTAPFILSWTADDDYNASRLDRMVALGRDGYEIVCPSRFIPGGAMTGCPWLKAVLVRLAAVTLYFFARLPTHDATNGFRFFSRRTLRTIPIESRMGFAFSLELLAKAHRLRWKIAEVAVEWHEREEGSSRFQVIRWLPQYLRWYFYAFATTWLRRPPGSVRINPA